MAEAFTSSGPHLFTTPPLLSAQDANKHRLPWHRALAWYRDINRGEAARHWHGAAAATGRSTVILLSTSEQMNSPESIGFDAV